MPTTLNKPAGLSVFPPHADPQGDCLLRRLLADHPWRAALDWPRGYEGGIAHRLDNATSGAMLVADSPQELRALREAFAAHRFVKTYLLMTGRDAAWNQAACDLPIAHSKTNSRKMVLRLGPMSKHRGKWYPARTEFRRLHGRLYEAIMSSGVTHQIRLHAAHLEIPLLGDTLYGGDPTPEGLFRLHHVGMTGPDPFRTDPLPPPDWARPDLP
jgi:23S rRNA pseudouridine1911/1915/1917 synthase